jgi:hypothetical protein
VVDDHHRLRAEQSLAEQQGPYGVVRRDATSVSNEVHLTEVETECTKEVESRVHAREDREAQTWSSGQFAVSVRFHVRAIMR